jgi:hypothetical protein
MVVAVELAVIALAMKPLVIRPPAPIVERKDARMAPTVVIQFPIFEPADLQGVFDS